MLQLFFVYSHVWLQLNCCSCLIFYISIFSFRLVDRQNSIKQLPVTDYLQMWEIQINTKFRGLFVDSKMQYYTIWDKNDEII